MRKQSIHVLFTVLGMAIVLASHLFGQSNTDLPSSTQRRIAFTAVRNISGDPRMDYLGGIVQGLLLYDLSRAEGIILVDRASLDRVLMELELQLSGIVDDRGAASKVGKLLGVDFLVSAEFVALSGEVLVTAKSVEVSSGRQVSFIERGSTENIVHRLSESLAEYYSGKKQVFSNPAFERSILTMRDESPGSIALHSIMQRAEILLDGDFVGYTTGDSAVPFLLEKLTPGKHTVSVHYGNGFGVVRLPEVIFEDWKLVVDVQPGKRHVVRDETRSFNSVLYNLENLVNEDFVFDKSKSIKPFETSFVDRAGANVKVVFNLEARGSGSATEFLATLSVNGDKRSWTLSAEPDKEVKIEGTVGLVRFTLSVDMRYDRIDVGYSLERTDVWQGMFDKR